MMLPAMQNQISLFKYLLLPSYSDLKDVDRVDRMAGTEE